MRVESTLAAHEVDVAIVGAGITGLYLAYRISCDRPDLSVVVLEASDRIGGRLRSVCHDETVLECGASFVSDAHAHALGLARALNCSLIETHFRCGGIYLRGRSQDHGFLLAPDEKNQSAAGLVLAALQRLAPAVGPLSTPQGIGAQVERLRAVCVDGRGLWDWSIGALLRRTLSEEAFALARATHGSTAAFGEANAFDTLVTQIVEAAPRQSYFQFERGFESLALALAEAMPPVRAGLGHQVVSVRRQRAGLRLRAVTNQGATEMVARQVFLALPSMALKRVRFSPDLARPWCGADVNTVTPVKAFKLFLEFEGVWWRDAVGDLERGEIAATFTDLPVQQIYFQGGQHKRPTVMAAFADDHGAEFWSSLRGELKQSNRVGAAPRSMIDAAMRELRRIYPFAPDAVHGLYADWAQGGWHAWKPGVKSWEVAPRMQQPHADVPLFVCGEAFSQLQGWTEGALHNAEATLERALGLGRPHWLDGNVPFATKGNEHASFGFLGASR